jgi:hypothetical protein
MKTRTTTSKSPLSTRDDSKCKHKLDNFLLALLLSTASIGVSIVTHWCGDPLTLTAEIVENSQHAEQHSIRLGCQRGMLEQIELGSARAGLALLANGRARARLTSLGTCLGSTRRMFTSS